jgi:hypothetical protein
MIRTTTAIKNDPKRNANGTRRAKSAKMRTTSRTIEKPAVDAVVDLVVEATSAIASVTGGVVVLVAAQAKIVATIDEKIIIASEKTGHEEGTMRTMMTTTNDQEMVVVVEEMIANEMLVAIRVMTVKNAITDDDETIEVGIATIMIDEAMTMRTAKSARVPERSKTENEVPRSP